MLKAWSGRDGLDFWTHLFYEHLSALLITTQLPLSNFKNKRNLVEPLCEWIIIPPLCCAELSCWSLPPNQGSWSSVHTRVSLEESTWRTPFPPVWTGHCSAAVLFWHCQHLIQWMVGTESTFDVNLIFIFLLKMIAILFVTQALFKFTLHCAVNLGDVTYKYWFCFCAGSMMGNRWGAFTLEWRIMIQCSLIPTLLIGYGD